jgi:hypothetical protein
MFGIGEKSIKERVNEIDLSMSHDLQMLKPRYEYTVKVFEEGEKGKPITSIQKGVKANSDADLHALFALSDQRVQILEKREINPPQNQQVSQQPQMPQQMPPQAYAQTTISAMTPQQKPAEPTVKYFSGGGIDFKLVGDNELYQKQWVRATEDDCKKIRIINDANNKIVELKGKHFELLNWVKVETSDKALG